MSIKLSLVFLFYFKLTNSQYYGLPSSPYQPYNYYSPSHTPPSLPPIYAPALAYPSTFTQPAFAPPAYSPASPALPAYTPSTLPSVPSSWSPSYPPTPSTYAPTIPPYPAIPSKPPVLSYSPYIASNPTPKFTPVASTPKCQQSTAMAYYLTSVQEAPKAAVIKEKVKESILEKQLPPPAYNCPYCTGFANVPKNPKVPPPPPCSSVLPGILDKIPTIALPEQLKLKSLSKLTPPPTLLSDLLEHKLSGKLRFDEDLLDGFLTGLGLEKWCG